MAGAGLWLMGSAVTQKLMKVSPVFVAAAFSPRLLQLRLTPY